MVHTYVVIAILGEEGYPLSSDPVTRCLRELLLLLQDICDEVPVGKRAGRGAVDNGWVGLIVVLDCLE